MKTRRKGCSLFVRESPYSVDAAAAAASPKVRPSKMAADGHLSSHDNDRTWANNPWWFRERRQSRRRQRCNHSSRNGVVQTIDSAHRSFGLTRTCLTTNEPIATQLGAGSISIGGAQNIGRRVIARRSAGRTWHPNEQRANCEARAWKRP